MLARGGKVRLTLSSLPPLSFARLPQRIFIIVALERKLTSMGIFSLRDKVNDLFARSNHYKKADAPQTQSNSDSASTQNDEFSYGVIDKAGKRDNEERVYIPQGNAFVPIFYNGATREARPVPVGN
jgi:hypothetical protein